jgi:hypothetical protein
VEQRPRADFDQGAHVVNVEHRRAVDRDERRDYDLHARGRIYRSGNELVAGDADDSAGKHIVLIPMILNAHAGTKYGVSFPVLCRASFGTKGANIPAILRAIVACGWFGIQTWIGGTAIDAL